MHNKTNHFWRNIFLIEKKFFKKLVFSRFHVGSVIPRNGSEDPDPDQNEADPKHWLVDS